MKVYHWSPNAAVILRDGFRDSESTGAGTHPGRGVWLSDSPVDQVIGGTDDLDLLEVELPADVLLTFERVTPGEVRAWREFLVPAEIVNRYGPPSLLGERS